MFKRSDMKSIIITGANRGVGKSIKEYLYDYNDHFEIISLDSTIENDFINDRLISLKCNVANLQQIRETKSKVLKHMNGNLFAIISNAGIHQDKDSPDYYDEFEKIFRVNFLGAVFAITEFLPLLESNSYEKYKHIIAISSIASLTGIPTNPAYAASKAALDSYVKSIARAKANKNILVNSINPAWINTDMLLETIEKYSDGTEKGKIETAQKFKNQSLLKRFTEKEEIAKTVYFLISNNQTSMTGQQIILDNGHRLNL